VLLLPIALFQVGYVGAERIWYRQIWWKSRLRLGEIWTLGWFFFGRFLLLAIIVLPLAIPAAAVLISKVLSEITFAATENGTVGTNPDTFADVYADPVVFGVIALTYVVMDLLLTFATPALAFTTSRPVEALRINRRVIREQFPTSLLYVLIPSFALVLLLRTSYTNIAIGAGVTAFNLLMKGATAAFYLRGYGEAAESDVAALATEAS